MNHSELNMARCINMLDDTRRLLLKIRQGLQHDDDLYPVIKSTVNGLDQLGSLARANDSRLLAFDGVFFLRSDEAQVFVSRYRAHLATNKKGG